MNPLAARRNIGGEHNWHVAMFALVSLFGVSVLLLALQSGVLLDNPLFKRLQSSPIISPQISVPHNVSLDLHLVFHPINPWKRFSVAQPSPANVALSHRFLIGRDARARFEIFAEAALHDTLAEKGTARTVPELKPRNDRLLLTLMLLGLNPGRR